jgi:hypothetical protein
MSYLADRLKTLGVVLLIFAIYLALPYSIRQHYGDAAFTALFCLGMTLYILPATYFRRSIPALGMRKRRNLARNWVGLLASTGVAAAYAQHESAKGHTIPLRRNGSVSTGIVVGVVVFWATYLLLWIIYRKFIANAQPEHHLHDQTSN